MKHILSRVGTAVRVASRLMGAAGRATIALIGICTVGIAFANYTMTQGAGTNFGSVVVSTVHYAQTMLCDLTTPAQCAAVSSGGAVKVDASATTQPVSAASLPLPSGAATSANQTNNTQTTRVTDGTNTAAVKAASTAPVATDPAVVVAVSPNGSAVGATAAAVPANAAYMGAISAGNLTGVIQADSSAAITVSTATTTQIVALASTKKIYVTSYDVVAAGTGNIQFVYGTGSSCGTGTTNLTGNYNLVAQAGIAKGTGIGPVLVVPASNALCVTTSAAVGMAGSVAYTQF